MIVPSQTGALGQPCLTLRLHKLIQVFCLPAKVRTGVGTTTSPETLFPGSGEVEVLLGIWGWPWSHFSSKKSHSQSACQ